MSDKHETRPSDTWLSLEEAIRYSLGAAAGVLPQANTDIIDRDFLKDLAADLERYVTIKHDTMLNPNRSKGEKIVADCLIHGEPFFVFRARDIFSTMVLKRYLIMLEEYGPDDPDFQANIVQFLGVLKKWQTENVAAVRYPD
jgi:hypothetical protein